MNRKATRQQVETAVTPMLTKGEQLRRSGPAWAVERRGKAPLLFRARDLHEVVLTDQRLILLTRPRRRRPLGVNNLVMAKRYSTFSLDRARRLRPMFQVRVRTSADRVLVLEFRPRDRRLGRALAAELRPTKDEGPKAARAHPVAPEPATATPAPPGPEPVRLEQPPPPALTPSEPLRLEPPAPASTSRELVRLEPSGPVTGSIPEKLSRKEKRRARKESKRAAKEQKSAGEDTPERRDRPERRQNWEGPPGGFERRGSRERRSGWDDAKPSRKERRQARKDRKQRDRGSGDIDIIEQLRQ